MALKYCLILCFGIFGMALAFAGKCQREMATSNNPHLPTLSPDFVAISDFIDQIRNIENQLNARNVYPRMTAEAKRKLEAELKGLEDSFIKYVYEHHATIDLTSSPLLEAGFILRAKQLVDKRLEDKSSEGKLQYPWLNELKTILLVKDEQIRRRINATVFNQRMDEANAEASARAGRNPRIQQGSPPRSPRDESRNRSNRDAWGAGAGLPNGDLD